MTSSIAATRLPVGIDADASRSQRSTGGPGVPWHAPRSMPTSSDRVRPGSVHVPERQARAHAGFARTTGQWHGPSRSDFTGAGRTTEPEGARERSQQMPGRVTLEEAGRTAQRCACTTEEVDGDTRHRSDDRESRRWTGKASPQDVHEGNQQSNQRHVVSRRRKGGHRPVVQQTAEPDHHEGRSWPSWPPAPTDGGTGHDKRETRQAVDRLPQPAIAQSFAV